MGASCWEAEYSSIRRDRLWVRMYRRKMYDAWRIGAQQVGALLAVLQKTDDMMHGRRVILLLRHWQLMAQLRTLMQRHSVEATLDRATKAAEDALQPR